MYSIHSLCSILCWCTFGSNYSLDCFWIWCWVLDPTTVYFTIVSPFPCNLVRLDGKWWYTAIFRSLHGCSERCGCMFRVVVLLKDELRPRALWSRFSSRISLYIAPSIFLSILIRQFLPEKHPYSMMPPLFLTVGLVLAWWCTLPGFLQTCRLEFTPKSSIFVSSDQRIFFFVSQAESPLGASWQASGTAAMCLLLSSGFHLAPRASVAIPRFVPRDNPVSEVYRQFLWLHAWFVLWRALSTVGPGGDRCVSFQFMSNQLNFSWLAETSQGWSVKTESPWAQFWTSRKRLWIPMHMWFLWGFHSK